MIGERIKSVKAAAGEGQAPARHAAQGARATRHLPHLAGRLHQRRQVDAVQCAGQGARLRRRPAVRHARHHHARAVARRTQAARCRCPTRWASSATCRTSWSRPSRPRCRKRPTPTCCCTWSMRRARCCDEQMRRGRARARRDRRRRQCRRCWSTTSSTCSRRRSARGRLRRLDRARERRSACRASSSARATASGLDALRAGARRCRAAQRLNAAGAAPSAAAPIRARIRRPRALRPPPTSARPCLRPTPTRVRPALAMSPAPRRRCCVRCWRAAAAPRPRPRHAGAEQRRAQRRPARPGRAVARLQPQAQRPVRRQGRRPAPDRNADRPPDGGPPFQPDMKSAGIGVGLIAGVVALVWLGSGFFIVQEGQQAVVTSFGTLRLHRGRRHPVALSVPVPGARDGAGDAVALGRGGPQHARCQATGLRDSSMLTQDENIVDIRFTVQYRLKDARAFLFENRNPDEAVVQAAESAVREIVGRSKVDSVLYEQRDAIASRPAEVGAGAARPAEDRHPGRQRQRAERAGARAGAGGVQRRGQGRRPTATASRTKARPTPAT